MRMAYHLTNFLHKMLPAANDSNFNDDHEERVERLKAKQKAMFDEMMANGTHMFCRTDYTRGDSRVLRDAGLVK